jgi:hypothetical protein
MPDPILQVPIRQSATITAGETLTINFTEDCCFCCDADKINNFVPPLPVGDQIAGYSWSGVAQVTGTINFHHTPYGTPCDKKHGVATAGRTIIVGS